MGVGVCSSVALLTITTRHNACAAVTSRVGCAFAGPAFAVIPIISICFAVTSIDVGIFVAVVTLAVLVLAVLAVFVLVAILVLLLPLLGAVEEPVFHVRVAILCVGSGGRA